MSSDDLEEAIAEIAENFGFRKAGWTPDPEEKKQTNDGRDTCYACGEPTKKIDTGMFQDMRICTKCGK